MSLARKINLRNSYVAPAARVPQRDRLLLPAPPGDKADKAAPATITMEGRPIRRLTQAEQEERRRLSLCYNYDEKFGRGHNHVCKRLFLLDGVPEEANDDEPTDEDGTAAEETPHFSLHAIAGVPFSDTMQLKVVLGDITLTALLDLGSMHNFIAETAAHRTGLPLQRQPRLTVTVANGERVTCPGVIRQAPLTITADTFRVDLFVMPLAGYDLVLGTQWLATLGPVLWDFSARKMSFQR